MAIKPQNLFTIFWFVRSAIQLADGIVHLEKAAAQLTDVAIQLTDMVWLLMRILWAVRLIFKREVTICTVNELSKSNLEVYIHVHGKNVYSTLAYETVRKEYSEGRKGGKEAIYMYMYMHVIAKMHTV